MPQKVKKIKAEDLYKFEYISGARISPDGKNVVYAQHRIIKKKEEKVSNLWIAPSNFGNPWQFTYGDQKDTSPIWSPDGKKIVFLSNRGNKEKPPQIYLIYFNGGEAKPMSNIQGSIGSFSWSPNNNLLLCTVRKTDKEALDREKDPQKKKLGVVARNYDRVFFKLDGFGYLPREQWHIWTIDVKSGTGKQLTNHNFYSEQYPYWSPDGKKIVFISNRSENPDFQRDSDDIFIMDLETNQISMLPTTIGKKTFPVYSPDGKWIAYFGQEGEGQWYKNNCLWIVEENGNSTPINLTEKYDIHASANTLKDMGDLEQVHPLWSYDSTKVYFQVDYHGCTLLKSIDINGDSLQTVAGENASIGSFSFNKTQDKIAYLRATIKSPGQIWTQDVKSNKTKQLTNINKNIFRNTDLGEIEETWFKGVEGNDLQGWILKPPGFDPDKKYPSILEIHGGPMMQYGNFFMHEFHYLAANGYVVYFSNPRGGRGYGEDHTKAIWGGWGNADYDDLMAFTDMISNLPYIDKERMGLTGGSYGGYMTLWIIGHTLRFKAAVAQRVLSNFISFWGSTDFNWIWQQVLGDGTKAPFEDVDKFWNHSPMKYIGRAKTPTLIIHSEMDLRCPIEQGEQAFVALKRLGVPTEMVRFPDEPHGLSREGRTDRRIARLKHIKRWFDLYL